MLNRKLITFLCVAKKGSFTKASKELLISTVSIMEQMNTLERELDVKLFVRTNHGVQLTQAGKSFYGDIQKLSASCKDIIKHTREIAKQSLNDIRIGTSILRPCGPLLEMWTSINQKTASFQMKIVPYDDNPSGMDNMTRALRKDIDCFVGAYTYKWARIYQVYDLGTYEFCCAMPKTHRLAKKERLTWDDLNGETFWMLQPGESPTLDALWEELKQNHPLVRGIPITRHYDLAVFNECVKEGCLMQSLSCWSQIHPALATIPVEWDYRMPYGIIYSRQPSMAFQAFIDEIKISKWPENFA